MKKFITGLVLLIIAVIVFLPLAIWGIIELIIELFYKSRFLKSLGKFGDIILIIAILIDIALNVICQVPLNRFFKQKDGYKFGDRRDTVSRVLGVNERDNTLTKSGKRIVYLLDKIDKDHCKKSI